MEEAIRILFGSHDVSAAEEQDQDPKAFQVDGCQDGKLCSSKSCLVAVEDTEAKSNRVVRSRIEKILRKLYDRKSSSRSKTKKLHLAMNKSSCKKLERSNLNAETDFPVSNESVNQTIPGSHSQSFTKNCPSVSHSYNVYSYYYPKYDMSYGHCLYVTPWTLEVPTDNTLHIAECAGVAKQLRLLSLERNWKRIGWKRRVNSAKRSFTFPANAEWESTIYYFPRWDLSFHPLPISRVRPSFGVDLAFPVETVLEEDIKAHTFRISASSVKETKDPRTSPENQAQARKPRQPVLTVGPLQVDRILKRPSFSVTNGFVCKSEMILHSSVTFDVETGKLIGDRSVEEGTSEECHQPIFVSKSNLSRMHSVHTLFKEESVSIVEKQKTSRKRLRVERKTAMQKLVFVRSSGAGISSQTRAGDIIREDHTLRPNSTVDLPQRRNSDREPVQTTTRQIQKDTKNWCKSCHFVEFTQYDFPPLIGKDIQNAPKPRLGMLQDLQPVVIREAPKTYLSIWQNRRAIYAEFLKRNPTFVSIAIEHRTN